MAKSNGNGNGNGTELAKREEMTPEKFAGQQIDKSALFDAGFQSEFTVALKPGNSFAGLFIGAGPDIEKVNDDTGEVTYLKTWRVKAAEIHGKREDGSLHYSLGGATAQVVGAYDLNKFFSSLTPGNTIVVVEHLGKQQIGVKQVNRYNKFYFVDTKLQPSGPALADTESKERREAQAQAQATA